MAHIIKDRVRETWSGTGPGTATLAGAETGFRAFGDVCANGDTVPYAIAHRTLTEWEVGIGTWATGGVLTRTTVLASSNSGSAVSFSAGTKDVFLTVPAASLTRTLRPKVSGVSLYDVPGSAIFSQGTETRLGGRYYYEPFIVGHDGLYVSEVAIQVSSAASSGNTIRLAIGAYGENGLPGALLWGVTGISITTTGKKTATPNIFLPPGRYCKGLWPTADVGLHTWRGIGGSVRSSMGGGWDIVFRHYGYRDPATYTTWPDPLVAPDTIDNDSNGFSHCIVIAV